MNIPDYLHNHVAEVIAIEQSAAIRRRHWAVVLGLTPYRDGNTWCVLWGDDIQEGIVGFGATPEDAILAFDDAMCRTAGFKRLPGGREPLSDMIEREMERDIQEGEHSIHDE